MLGLRCLPSCGVPGTSVSHQTAVYLEGNRLFLIGQADKYIASYTGRTE